MKVNVPFSVGHTSLVSENNYLSFFFFFFRSMPVSFTDYYIILISRLFSMLYVFIKTHKFDVDHTVPVPRPLHA